MKFIYITTIIFVLCTQCITAVNAGENYNITTVKCYGDIIVKFRSEQNITENEYNFVDCTQKDEEYWNCKCNDGGETLIQLYTKPKTVNVYDIKLSYYIEPKQPEDDDPTTQTKGEVENDVNERTKSFTNLLVGPAPKKPFQPPPKNFVIIIISVVAFVIVLVSTLGYYGYKFLAKDDSSTKVYNPTGKEETKTNVDMTDEEILEYIRNNAK